MPEKILPDAPFGRILIHSGAKRVSAKALAAFSQSIEATGLVIATKSIEVAKHSGRRTVHGSDVKLAKHNV